MRLCGLQCLGRLHPLFSAYATCRAAGEALVDAVAHETEEAGEEVVCERIDIGDVDPVDLLPQV